ncbi:MAG: hypothetical protein E7211_14180 [Clostridium lundense]|nr:hypothetical protein [Clostridium lundense]
MEHLFNFFQSNSDTCVDVRPSSKLKLEIAFDKLKFGRKAKRMYGTFDRYTFEPKAFDINIKY